MDLFIPKIWRKRLNRHRAYDVPFFFDFRASVQHGHPEEIRKLEREALTCAIVSFPIVLFSAVGFDIAFIFVSFYPSLMFFLGIENIMPAYSAYRILIEVVLEALPQVLSRVHLLPRVLQYLQPVPCVGP
jgi:hypothetical protein